MGKAENGKDILTGGKIYQIKYAVFYLILQVIGFEYVGMKLLLYGIATKFAVGCKFCNKRLFCIIPKIPIYYRTKNKRKRKEEYFHAKQ